MFKKMLLVLGFLLTLLLAGGLVFIWQVGAWNILFPSSQHDQLAPQLPAGLNSGVLVFSKTNSFRHKEGIAGGLEAFAQIAEQMQFEMFATENGAVFNPQDLARFDVVVFLNATGDMLNEAQETAFKDWLEAGGGWLGIHAAGDGSHAGWTWYVENLLGAEFTAHILGPQFQTATLVTEQIEHPANAELPASWDALEEWYSWKESPRQRGFQVLATVDENTYSPVQNLFGNSRDLRMGDHPITWTNCVGAGRTFYTALGHTREAFAHHFFQVKLSNALHWLRGDAPCQKQ